LENFREERAIEIQGQVDVRSAVVRDNDARSDRKIHGDQQERRGVRVERRFAKANGFAASQDEANARIVETCIGWTLLLIR
jgi:hypothetical protein